MGFLEGLKPGEKRRDDDKALREHLARRLNDVTQKLRQVAAHAGRAKLSLDKLQPVVEINRRHDELDRMSSELQHASYGDWGYRGGKDKHEKRRDDDHRLALVAEFDETLDADVNALAAAADQLDRAASSGGDLAAGLGALDGHLTQLRARLRQREELLKNPERTDWPDQSMAAATAPAAPSTAAPAASPAGSSSDRKE